MPGACLSLWPTEECQWSTWDIWRSSDVVGRAIYLCLALMLVYTFFVLIRFVLRYNSARHQLGRFSPEYNAQCFRNRRRLISELSRGLGTLKAVSSLAPFLGLAGTCYGIMSGAFMGLSIEKHTAMRAHMIGIASSLVTAAAGILVAVPATVCYNVLRTGVESRSSRFSINDPRTEAISSFQFAQTLPLKPKLSKPPSFAVVAAPVLACVIILFSPFHPYRVPTGFAVLLPSGSCQLDVPDRLVVLQVSERGELSINTEPLSWTDLPFRVSQIYRTRASRELYLRAEDGASFQMVADAIDSVSGLLDPEFHSPLDINVLLITPQANEDIAKCIPRIQVRPRHRARK